MYRSLIVLTLAQAFAQSATPIVVLLGGIIGATMAPSVEFATLPIALMIVGTATTSIPAAVLMSRVGRKAGFLFGCAYASLAGLIAVYAIVNQVFILFCLATFIVGSHNAFIQQYRFAAVETVPPDKVATTLSILMLAGVVAAFTGPEIAIYTRYASELGEFVGSFFAITGMMVCAFLILCFYPNSKLELITSTEEQRPLPTILKQPRLILAVAAGAVGYGVMSFVMTATPVSMHTVDHHSFEDTAWVIQSHIMAMYLPSLFSGILIARFGSIKIIFVGLVLMLVCLAIANADRQLMHYWWALIFLGVGWNFLFLGGTTLLTENYRPSERYKVQALNDFLIFTLQAMAALGSGVILANYGWNWVLAVSLPWLVLLLPILWMGSRAKNTSHP
ncbi:MAG: MFS transporter [Pseudomonadales bacterium]|nr:MFS transporter [Pseudomonadales bacterium]